MNKNSLTVYYNEVLPNLPKKQQDVLNALEMLNRATIYQVARFMNVFPNQISGRFSELKKEGLVEIVDTIKQNNRPHSVYKIYVD